MPTISFRHDENNRLKRKVSYKVCCNEMKKKRGVIKTVKDDDN